MPSRFVGETFDCRSLARAWTAAQQETQGIRNALFVVPFFIFRKEFHALFHDGDFGTEQIGEFAVGLERFHGKMTIIWQFGKFLDAVNVCWRVHGMLVEIKYFIAQFVFDFDGIIVRNFV